MLLIIYFQISFFLLILRRKKILLFLNYIMQLYYNILYIYFPIIIIVGINQTCNKLSVRIIKIQVTENKE